MVEAPNMYPDVNDQHYFRLNKSNEFKDYFIAEIRERKLMSERLSKYIGSSDYFDKSLIVLSATSGSISIASFATVIGAPVGIAILLYIFSNYRNCKKIVKSNTK